MHYKYYFHITLAYSYLINRVSMQIHKFYKVVWKRETYSKIGMRLNWWKKDITCEVNQVGECSKVDVQGLHAVGQGDHEPMDHGFGGGRAGRQVGSEVVQGRHLQPGCRIRLLAKFGSGALYLERRDFFS